MADNIQIAKYRAEVLESIFEASNTSRYLVAWVDDTQIAIREAFGEGRRVVVNLHKTHASALREGLDLPSVDQQLNGLVRKLTLAEAGTEGKAKGPLASLVVSEIYSRYEASITESRVKDVILDLVMEGELVVDEDLLKVPSAEEPEGKRANDAA